MGVAGHFDRGAVGRDSEIEGRGVLYVELGDLAVLGQGEFLLYGVEALVLLVLLPGGAPVEEVLAGGGIVEVVLEGEVQVFEREGTGGG